MSKDEKSGNRPAAHVGDALPPTTPSPWPVTTPTGVAIEPCLLCGHEHPVSRRHCLECGAASLFVDGTGHCLRCRNGERRPALWVSYGGEVACEAHLGHAASAALAADPAATVLHGAMEPWHRLTPAEANRNAALLGQRLVCESCRPSPDAVLYLRSAADVTPHPDADQPIEGIVPCAWCDNPYMDEETCPNARDLCLDCCGEGH